MRNVLALLLLLTVIGCNQPTWTKVDQDDRRTVYADLTSKTPKGSNVQMNTLIDLKTPGTHNKPYFSITALYEYDCTDRKEISRRTTFYPDPMGKGKEITSASGSAEAKPVKAGSVNEELWKLACDKPTQ